MNLQQLEYFKIIAETKNFTTASEILSVTQPALSKAISKLEEELEIGRASCRERVSSPV